MKRLMQYYIISGNVLEGRQSVLPDKGGRRPRGIRRAGTSSAKKISANERQEALRLARVIRENFTGRDVFVSLKFDNERLPKNYEELCERGEKLMRKLRSLCAKEGVELRRILVNANWSPRRCCPARLHHHMILNREALPLLMKLWPEDQIDYVNLRGKDYTELAGYMAANAKSAGEIDPDDYRRWERGWKGACPFADLWRRAGGKKWAPSKGLRKPVYSEPVPAPTPGSIPVPAGATDVIMQPSYDEEGRQTGCYMRCVLPERPKLRGGQIVLPGRAKRGGRQEGKRGETA